MEDPRNQLIKMASDAELERRWKAVREMMREKGIDYLVMQNSEEYMGGTLRWFTDWAADIGFPYTVIFPVDDDMTVINWGIEPPATPEFPPQWYLRGIKKTMSCYYMPTHSYTKYFDAMMAVKVLSEKNNPVVGWVERSMIPVTFAEYITDNLPGATFVDATDWIDDLRVPKSPEEIEMIRETAAMQDAFFDHLKTIIQPGMRGIDIHAEVMYFCLKRGCTRMNCMVSSGPLGTAAAPAVIHLQGRKIQPGDQVFVLLEGNGPGGQWTEAARTFLMGVEPSPELAHAWAHAVNGQEYAASLLVPGAVPFDIVSALEDYNVKNGYDPTIFDLAHGMGYSMVERPMVRKREPMTLVANSSLAVHLHTEKHFDDGRAVFAMCVDNYLVGAAGGAERIHKYPKDLIVV